MTQKHLITGLLVFMYSSSFAQGIIRGTVLSEEGPVPFANIGLAGTEKGAYSDENGNFLLKEIPSGKYKILFSSVGFLSAEKALEIHEHEEIELNVILQKSFRELDEIVVTGTRNETKRTDSPVIVGVLNKKSLESTQSNNLAEGLNFQTGLRMETDCQTCGYSQLRMNGLGGAYSQVLIDGRPVFNALMGLYGLEQIPTSMIDRIEVVKGGGSAIYGSSAIAGTVNVITTTPKDDLVSVGMSGGVIDGQSVEGSINAAITKVNKNAGFSVVINQNSREPYDANDDGFSELPKLHGLNVGLNTTIATGKYGSLGINLNSINEYRRGGNNIEEPAHKTDQAEERQHDIILGGINYKWSMPELKSSASAYFSGQHTTRKHYTGIDGADAYGNTWSNTMMGGFQFNFSPKSHTLTLGSEYIYDDIFDEIPLYDYKIDQQTRQFGLYVQEDWKINSRLTLLGGVRMDLHNFVDDPVYNPRVNLLYKPFNYTQFRIGYSTGFRAPQAFDTDLHIAFAGGGVSIITLDPNLIPETSGSYSASFNFDKPSEKSIYGFTIDAFHTQLNDAFILENTGTDENGNMEILKTNGGGSTVKGISIEARLNYNDYVETTVGFTLQNSVYEEPVQWSSELEGTTQYLRTPDQYGFLTIDFMPVEALSITYSGVFTGTMDVPHFAGAPGTTVDELVKSGEFYDQSIKVGYSINIPAIKSKLQFFTGVKNIFNAYQDDFDIGKNRDSNYVYGPARPRTIYLGLKFETQ